MSAVTTAGKKASAAVSSKAERMVAKTGAKMVVCSVANWADMLAAN